VPSGGARKGAGRPSGTSKDDTADSQLQIRVTTHEKEEFRRRAFRRKMSISEYVKDRCISGIEPEETPIPPVCPYCGSTQSGAAYQCGTIPHINGKFVRRCGDGA